MIYDNPKDVEAFEAFEAFEAAYPDQLAQAKKVPGLQKIETSPLPDGKPVAVTRAFHRRDGGRGRRQLTDESHRQPHTSGEGRRRSRSGKTVGSVKESLGIPYAAPPVDALRWRPPQAAGRWTGVREASESGSNRAQPKMPLGLPSSSEDCLYLNVYAPSGRQHGSDAHPVMVWIHGGGWWLGEGNDYDPSQLAADGTVVVTINYRLGALAFLALPALADTPGAPLARTA